MSVHLFIISPISFCAENNPDQCDSGGARKCFSGASSGHAGPEKKEALKSIHRDCKSPLDLVRSLGCNMGE
jgi:hypothetical protein